MGSWDTAVGVVADLVRLGVGEFVVCGGAGNAVVLEVLGKLEERGGVKVWSHFEERSAGFFALGRVMESGKPCAVVVTSGTAVAELLPAAVEGFYQGRPLVLVTADRAELMVEGGAPQAIYQEGIFGRYAEVDAGKWEGKGPLHVNVRLGEEIRMGGIVGIGEVGEFQVDYGRPNVGRLARFLRERTLRGMVVMIGGLEADEREEVFHFCKALDAPVVAEATSGLREALQHLAVVDEDIFLKEHPPSKVLRLGGVPSGRFWRDLEGMAGTEIFSVCRNGMRGLGRDAEVLRGDLERVLRAVGEVEGIGDVGEILRGAEGRGGRIEEMLEAFPDSEAGWMRTISVYAAMGESVYLGNSLPIREWNAFAQWERPVGVVRANRGANGIDGQVSAWLGASAREKGAWGIFGDLTALYDTAGLRMLEQVEMEGRVMVVMNNGGGRIFDGLARLDGMGERARGWMRAGTEVDFGGLARMVGMEYLRVGRTDEFEGVDGGVLVEVVPEDRCRVIGEARGMVDE